MYYLYKRFLIKLMPSEIPQYFNIRKKDLISRISAKLNPIFLYHVKLNK